MKTRIYLFSALAVAAMSSCNNEVSERTQMGNVNPIITTNFDVVSRTTEGFVEKTTFTSGDAMGIYLYKGEWNTPYVGDHNINNKATYNGTDSWEIANPMYLNADKGKMWAYYPYNKSVTDGTAIPVDITSNSTDYMYGTAKKEISVSYPYATIDMHHALSQFVIRLKPSPDYTLEGKVTNVKLSAKSTIFHQTGTMNVTNGTITGTSAKNALTWTPSSTHLETSANSDYKALVLPMTFNEGTVSLTVTIDGANYSYDFPQTTWEKGKRYIYSFEMSGNELVIGPDPEDSDGEYGQGGVLIEGWTDAPGSDIELTPVN